MVERRSCLNGKISFFTHLVSGRIVKIAIGFQVLLHYKDDKNPLQNALNLALLPKTTLLSHKMNIQSTFLEQTCSKL